MNKIKKKITEVKIGKLFIIIGITLIISSVIVIMHNSYLELNAGIKSKDAIKIIKNNINKEDYIQINNKEYKEMSTTNINGYEYIGIIHIPALNIELPVLSDYDKVKLNIAPCRYYGSIYTNDLIICAHSYKTHFKYLNKLVQGDIVIFTDVYGNNHIYEVLEIEILSPDEVQEMIDSEFDLTLYTCTSDGLNRVTIRCNKTTGSI